MAIETIRNLLHIKADIRRYSTKKLPVYLSEAYDLYVMQILDTRCLLARPKDKEKLVALKKQRIQMMKHTQLECVFYFDRVSTYIKRALAKEGIPYIVENQAVYLPFIGISMKKHADINKLSVKKIGGPTQRLLLAAMYERWREVSLTDAAIRLDTNKMAVSRCFDQIEGLSLPLIAEEGRYRRFVWKGTPGELWKMIRPYLRSPVVREYHLDMKIDPSDLLLGGISALSHWGNLNDNVYPTYAISKAKDKETGLFSLPLVPSDEQPQTLVQVLTYEWVVAHAQAVDPVTAYLSLNEKEREDPRIEKTFHDVMEEWLNGQGD